jgi:uncharacterized protein
MERSSKQRTRRSTSAVLGLIVGLISVTAGSGGGKVEEVLLDVGAARIAGVLSLPGGRGPHPAVLLLCGSGEQDRDWDIDGDGRYRMGALLAEALNHSGIAVLRLDDRGTGGSSGVRESLTSFEVLKRDALTAIGFLRRHKDIAEVGLGGFSSGAAIAVMSAAESQTVDFLIALSGPFVSGADILMAQAESFPEVLVPQPSEDRQDLLRRARRFQSLCVAAARGEDPGELEALLRENTRFILNRLPEAERAKIGNLEAEVEKHASGMLRGFQSDWFNSFVDYNPADDIPGIGCPILAVQGDKDNRVTAENGWRALLRVIAKEHGNASLDVSVRVFEGTNHFLTNREHALQGRMMPGVTDYLAGWILQKTGGRRPSEPHPASEARSEAR